MCNGWRVGGMLFCPDCVSTLYCPFCDPPTGTEPEHVIRDCVVEIPEPTSRALPGPSEGEQERQGVLFCEGCGARLDL